MKTLRTALWIALLCAPFAHAEEKETWEVSVQPYIWALGNEVRIATTEYDRSDYTGYIDALLNQYQYGFLWTTTARKGNWGLYMDGHFVRLKDSARELGLPYDSDIRQMLFEGAVMYRFGGEDDFAELFAGARYFRMKSAVDVKIVGEFNDLFDWFEPLVGLRLSHAMGKDKKWRCEVAGDIGGFEIGSDFTWQASAMLSYQFSERRNFSIGYRHIDIEYFDAPNRYESEMSGPVIGFGYKF
jgi:opacity protein-like surface antigen